MPGGNSEWEPPDPFSNSEVKTLSADGSVGSPHVRVGHRQALNLEGRSQTTAAFFIVRDTSVVASEYPRHGFTLGLQSPSIRRPGMCQPVRLAGQ